MKTKVYLPKYEDYKNLKPKYPEVVLWFRIGDFYECYDEDAKTMADLLGLTIKERFGYRYVGFPHFAIDTYLPRMIIAKRRVAIC